MTTGDRYNSEARISPFGLQAFQCIACLGPMAALDSSGRKDVSETVLVVNGRSIFLRLFDMGIGAHASLLSGLPEVWQSV